MTTLWACRPSGNRSSGILNGTTRPIRDMQVCAIHRSLLKLAQDDFCSLCGKPLNGEDSLDHAIPYALGGIDALGNLLLTHGLCNAKKADDIPTGCEVIWLLAVNYFLDVHPQKW